MTFVHVIRTDMFIAERTEHPHSPDTKHNLLLETHGTIPTVQVFGDFAVARLVPLDIRIEEEDVNCLFHPFQLVHPHPHFDVSPLYSHCNCLVDLLHEIYRIPVPVCVALRSIRVDLLLHVPVLPAHGDARGVQAHICAGPHDVPCEHPQSSGVRGHFTPDANLHGEICDFEVFLHVESFCVLYRYYTII